MVTLTDGELLLGDLQMPKMNFTQSKKFGDQLEKSIALTFIHAQHPDCTIKSPDDTGEFRDQGENTGMDIIYHNVKNIS